jgi:hypothetical protein
MVRNVMLAALITSCMTSTEPVRAVRYAQGGRQLARTIVPQDPSSPGYLNLHKRHPDGAEGPEEFTSGYGSDLALKSLTQIQSFLVSFRGLTERVRGSLNEAELRAIGNTSGEMQTIGFHNIPLTVEGTILEQNYQLRQAQYELAQLRHARGDIGVQDLNRARSAYEEATKRLQVFWDTRPPTN